MLQILYCIVSMSHSPFNQSPDDERTVVSNLSLQ